MTAPGGSSAPGVLLLVARRPSQGPSHDAPVAGEVGVSASGCVTVGGFVILAPWGSTVDGNLVHLETIGDARIGEAIAGKGGLVDIEAIPEASRPLGYERCGVTELAVISPR